MKQSVRLYIIAILFCISLTACNKKEISIETSIMENEKAGTNTEIEIWCWDEEFNGYAMRESARLYASINSNVTVKIVEKSWWDIKQRLSRAVLTGQYELLPEILLIQNTDVIRQVTCYTDMFADLSSSGIDFYEFSSDKVALSNYKGKQYGLPFDQSTTVAAYRMDLLDRAGYKIENLTDITWNEFIAIGKNVRNITGKPLLTNQRGSCELLMLMLESAGGSLFDKQGNPFILGNEILNEVIEIYKELVASGVLVEVHDWNAYMETLEKTGTAGAINGSWLVNAVSALEGQEQLWRVTNIPRLNKTRTATNYSNQGGATWFVMEHSENKELAIDFITQTLGSKVELYERMLLEQGIVGTYLPAEKSEKYAEALEKFHGQQVYREIREYAKKIPKTQYGIYNYEARSAVGFAVTEMLQGVSREDALDSAVKTYNKAIVE